MNKLQGNDDPYVSIGEHVHPPLTMAPAGEPSRVKRGRFNQGSGMRAALLLSCLAVLAAGGIYLGSMWASGCVCGFGLAMACMIVLKPRQPVEHGCWRCGAEP